MLKCLIHVQKTSKNKQNWPYLGSRLCVNIRRLNRKAFSIFFRDVFRFKVQLKFALNLLLRFLEIAGQNFPVNSEFGHELFF